MGLTQQEIAAAMGVNRDTLYAREGFPAAYQLGIDNFTGSLRRTQYLKAMTGDTPMLKFLGANYLNQSEKVRQELVGAGGGPVQHVDLTRLNDSQLSSLESILAAASPVVGDGKDRESST